MFIARQPIFNKSLKVYGYELLFRSNRGSKSFGKASATKATATIVGGLFEFGIEEIVDGTRAFVNFDYDFILSDSIELISPEILVIEVLEDVKVDAKLVKRLEDLRNKGYKIALDDFVEDYNSYPIVPIAHIIKYDILETPLDDIKFEVNEGLRQNKILLAEKIETEKEFLKAKNMGFNLFQGYFFNKPSIISKANNKKSTMSQYIRIIDELKKEEPSYQALAEMIETDVNLAYRLMRIISNRPNEDLVYSIKKALVYMGFKEIDRWINILMLQDLAVRKPKELMKLSLVRSKFSEYISSNSKYKRRKLEVAMMCLFSNIDGILDQTMEESLHGMPLTDDIKKALINKEGVLMPIFELITEYEKGNWDKVRFISNEIEMDYEKLFKGYIKSIKWTNKILAML